MVKSSLGIKLFLVLVMVMVNMVTIAPSLPILSPQSENTEDDSSTRIERSANLSHIAGTNRKIRMYIRNKYLQLFPDGTVNATDDESSDYTILQRSSVNAGQVKIQSIATCTFLCMDPCGLLYSTREFDDECVFHEMIEQHYYNTYSSAKYSNDKHIYYIGLTKRGTPRKVQIKSGMTLGKFSSITKVLPQSVEPHVVDRLAKKLQEAHGNSTHPHSLRHHQICPPPYHMKITESLKCKRKRKKKKKRKCHENEEENEECHVLKTAEETKKPVKKKAEDADADSLVKKSKKRKTDTKKKQSKSPKKESAERNTDGDGDDTMTTTIPDDGADDEFLDKD